RLGLIMGFPPSRHRGVAAIFRRREGAVNAALRPSTNPPVSGKPCPAHHTRWEKTTMAGYKLATYQTPDGPRAGLVIDDKVFDAAKPGGRPAWASVPGIREAGRAARGALKRGAAKAGKTRHKPVPLSRAKLLAPVRWPSAIYCAGANYADHAA